MARETSDPNTPLYQLYEQAAALAEPSDGLGEVIAAAEGGEVSEVVTSPELNGMYGPMMAAAAREQADAKRKSESEAARIEAVKILEQDEFKLGNLNPLINSTDLVRKESINAVKNIARRKIQERGGLSPKTFDSTVVYDPNSKASQLRFVARFETPDLNEEQLCQLEEIVRQTYGLTVRTRTDENGNDMHLESYPPTQLVGAQLRAKTGGWYMGPDLTPTSSLHQGLFVFRDLGEINKDNFFSSQESAGRYIVEIRDASQYQTDFVTFVTQVATVLGKQNIPDRGQLLYETYYDLMRTGLKNAGKGEMYGMEQPADMIRRELIIPLANPDISTGVRQQPESVLMVGVPGTGKTLLVEQLLQEETGVFILPVDALELQRELSYPKDKQYLLPRIADVARITGRRVVLHVDDIENMVTEDEKTNSTMLNLMAGVQESGFHIIASTNYPEKINPSLIQPQRFSVLIHCGLQNQQARYEILKLHALLASDKMEMPLFASDEVRDLILQPVAQHTEGFTPRYLADIATIAKSYLVARVSRETGRTIGLTEADLLGHSFMPDDWQNAYNEVTDKYDARGVILRDQELAEFVKKHDRHPAGFGTETGSSIRQLFSRELSEKIVAATVKLQHEQSAQPESPKRPEM